DTAAPLRTIATTRSTDRQARPTAPDRQSVVYPKNGKSALRRASGRTRLPSDTRPSVAGGYRPVQRCRLISLAEAEAPAERAQVASGEAHRTVGVMLRKGMRDKGDLLHGRDTAFCPHLAVQIAAQLLGQTEQAVTHPRCCTRIELFSCLAG